MLARLGPSQPPQGADVIARTVGALALIALAVIHVVDLPGTLGPDRLVGIGYLGIIAAAVLTGGVMIARSHWLAWAAAGAVAVSAMGGYVLTRAVPGGFLGDHGDVGNWHDAELHQVPGRCRRRDGPRGDDRPGSAGLLRGHPRPHGDHRVPDSDGHGPGRSVRQPLRLLTRPGAPVRWPRSFGRSQRTDGPDRRT